MTLQEQRRAFEANRKKKVYESALLTFKGVEGWDVYNTSTPFFAKGKRYLFGRVEKRKEWARSWCGLFTETRKDVWTLVVDAMKLPVEDPTVASINGDIVLEGTHVRRAVDRKIDHDPLCGGIDTYYGYFYKGKDPKNLYYFTTGPDLMKDIRLVQMKDKRIGVFSRPRSEAIFKATGRQSQIGFTVIDSLDQLTAKTIASAPYIRDMFAEGEWGGCNQALLLKDGMIGVISHQCYNEVNKAKGVTYQIYMNASFVFDVAKHCAQEFKIIGTRACYPKGPVKVPHTTHCAFTSGIAPRKDGRVDLYSGLSDAAEGRITIDNPFANHGGVVWK